MWVWETEVGLRWTRMMLFFGTNLAPALALSLTGKVSSPLWTSASPAVQQSCWIRWSAWALSALIFKGSFFPPFLHAPLPLANFKVSRAKVGSTDQKIDRMYSLQQEVAASKSGAISPWPLNFWDMVCVPTHACTQWLVCVEYQLLSGEGRQRETKGRSSPKGADSSISHHATKK